MTYETISFESFKVRYFFLALREVFCTFRLQFSHQHAQRIQTCIIHASADSVNIILGSTRNASVHGFTMANVSKAKVLPKHIGAKFSNLEELTAYKNNLEAIRSFYFDNMRRVQIIDLSFNKIIVIERGSFKDLFNVKYLYLGNNQIDTLDRDLFKAMVNLKNLDLAHNKINSMDPTTFEVSGGKLLEVNILSNVCLNKTYEVEDFGHLEDDIIDDCQPD